MATTRDMAEEVVRAVAGRARNAYDDAIAERERAIARRDAEIRDLRRDISCIVEERESFGGDGCGGEEGGGESPPLAAELEAVKAARDELLATCKGNRLYIEHLTAQFGEVAADRDALRAELDEVNAQLGDSQVDRIRLNKRVRELEAACADRLIADQAEDGRRRGRDGGRERR
jgi:chromosome segregation ATPase